MTLPAATSAVPTLPASVGRTTPTALAATPLGALFAQVLDANLQTETALSEDPALLSITEDNTAVLTSTPAQPEQDTAACEDTSWPPEGLACLWLPACSGIQPSLPASAAESTAQPQEPFLPLPANIPAATIITSVEMGTSALASTPQAALETTPPLHSSELSAQQSKPEFPMSFPAPAFPVSSDSVPESVALPGSFEPESEPLPHVWESGRAEGVSATATSATIMPSFTPASSISQPQSVPPHTPAPFPSPDLSADDFAQTLSPHIQWLAEHKIGHAHLQLNPQDMGPLEVRLKLEGDQLQAHFTSAEPDVRQALEHGLPRLRELLGDHGLHLSEGHVGQQQAQQHHFASSAQDETRPESETSSEPSPRPAPAAIIHTNHLLDAYV